MKTQFKLSNAVIMHGKAYATGDTIATIETPDGVDLDRVLNAILKGHAIGETVQEVAVAPAVVDEHGVAAAVMDGIPSPVAPAPAKEEIAKPQAANAEPAKVETAGEMKAVEGKAPAIKPAPPAPPPFPENETIVK